ncbi:hypothetical protein tpqmel_0620 [Candidatus Gastranaerophilus sp. (ex Termes propinquus)]|nr:hypothetical protein tpqmel_0620 [Candidatus Gastranaerophilus sp. (ex Termes propinquus)]
MGGILNFLKNLIGIGTKEEGYIGLSSFEGGSYEYRDIVKPKKKVNKKEISLSEILRRS